MLFAALIAVPTLPDSLRDAPPMPILLLELLLPDVALLLLKAVFFASRSINVNRKLKASFSLYPVTVTDFDPATPDIKGMLLWAFPFMNMIASSMTYSVFTAEMSVVVNPFFASAMAAVSVTLLIYDAFLP